MSVICSLKHFGRRNTAWSVRSWSVPG